MSDEISPKRAYKFSDGTLIGVSEDVRDSINTDLADLGTYGVTAATVTAFGVLMTNFNAVNTDEYMLGLVKFATTAKNTARTAVEDRLNNLEVSVRGKLGAGDGRVGGLGIRAMSQQSDFNLLRTARGAHVSATNILADLTGSGVDAAFLTALGTLITAFDTAIINQGKAVKNRDDVTRDRIMKGNLVYAELVRLASFGKDKYDDENEAKYNNYVIYESANAIGNTREGNLAAAAKQNLDFHEIEGTESYTVTGDTANDYELYFSDTVAGDPVGTPFAVVHSTTYTAQSAVALGWAADRPFMIVRNPGGTTVHYKVVKL